MFITYFRKIKEVDHIKYKILLHYIVFYSLTGWKIENIAAVRYILYTILLDYCIDTTTELLYLIRTLLQNINIIKNTIEIVS